MVIKKYGSTLIISLIILLESFFHRELYKFLRYISNRTILNYIIIFSFILFFTIVMFDNYSQRKKINFYNYLFSVLVVIYLIYINPRLIIRLKYLMYFILGFFSQKDKNKVSKVFHILLLTSVVVLWEFLFAIKTSGRILIGNVLQGIILVLSTLVLYNFKEK